MKILLLYFIIVRAMDGISDEIILTVSCFPLEAGIQGLSIHEHVAGDDTHGGSLSKSLHTC